MKINTSLQGLPIPIIGGRNQISGNLIWYGDFIAKLVTGGKKGASSGGTGKKGQGNYDYGAAVIIGLCQGPIQRVGNIWINNGYLPVNLTQESYTIPPGGGHYTVTQVNTFLQDMGCSAANPYSVSSDDYASPYGLITITGTQQTPMTANGAVGAAWQAHHLYNRGEIVFDGTNNQKCINSGTGVSGASAPSWNPTVGGQTTDGSGLFVTGIFFPPAQWLNVGPPAGSSGAGIYYEAGGTYYFSAADAGKTITINYTFAPPVNAGGVAQDPIVSLGLSFFNGEQGQAPWSYMNSKHPSQALGYSTLAYAATSTLDLGVSAALPNMQFEIYGLLPIGNGNWECDPSIWCYNFLTNPIWGVGFDSTNIGSLTQFSDYCVANGLFMSPVCDQSRTAADYLNEWLEATNTELVESGGVLNFIPRGDTTIVGNGQTFQPQTNPVYDLDEDAFIRKGSQPPVKVKRPTVQDAYNAIRAEYVDYFNNYNPSIVEAQDLGAIELYKYRPDATRSWHFFTQQAPAAQAVQTLLSRKVYIRNQYSFTLTPKYLLLDPMDIVTIPANLIYGTADTSIVNVRVTSVSENPDRTLNVEAEDFPWGCSGPTLYPRMESQPGIPSSMSPPGSINTPIIFEALSRLNNQIGHYVWFGLSGSNPNWGGATIWVSLDGTNYRKVGTAVSQTQMGTLQADFANHADPDTVDTCSVDLNESFGELESGTMIDADSNALLCYVCPGTMPPSAPWILQSPNGQLWQITISGSSIVSTAVSTGVVTPMLLNDLGNTTSWQLVIDNSGIVSASSITFAAENPLAIPFTGGKNVIGTLVSAALVLSVTTGGSAGGELISYETATLTNPAEYDINTYIRRGVYGSTIADHPAGSAFMLLNDAVEGWNYDVGIIGQTVYFKFTSFNQSGRVEENLADVAAFPFTITGACIGLLTLAHSSYRPDSNPLTAIDAGSSATIDIASFNLIVPGQPNIPIGSGAVTGLSYNTLYYVYFDDPGFIGGSFVFSASTNKQDALSSAGSVFVGSIVTPRAGAPDTFGNNDGGAGAQTGFQNQIPPTLLQDAAGTWFAIGDPSVGGIYEIADGNITTRYSVGGTVITFVVAGFTSGAKTWESLSLNVSSALRASSGSGTLSYSLDGGNSWTVIYSFGTGSWAQRTDTVSLPVSQNLNLLQVKFDSTSPSGWDIYEVWVSGVS